MFLSTFCACSAALQSRVLSSMLHVILYTYDLPTAISRFGVALKTYADDTTIQTVSESPKILGVCERQSSIWISGISSGTFHFLQRKQIYKIWQNKGPSFPYSLRESLLITTEEVRDLGFQIALNLDFSSCYRIPTKKQLHLKSGQSSENKRRWSFVLV